MLVRIRGRFLRHAQRGFRSAPFCRRLTSRSGISRSSARSRAKTSIDVAYVGSKSTDLQTQPSINDPAPGPGAIQARRPYPQWGSIVYGTFDGYGNYDALQAKFESRAWHGLTTLTSYAYSKCLDKGNGSTQYFQRTNRAVCDYDIKHTLRREF